MLFRGTGAEDDEAIFSQVEEVKARIAALLEIGLERRRAEATGGRRWGAPAPSAAGPQTPGSERA
jgi:hypothetical protein